MGTSSGKVKRTSFWGYWRTTYRLSLISTKWFISYKLIITMIIWLDITMNALRASYKCIFNKYLGKKHNYFHWNQTINKIAIIKITLSILKFEDFESSCKLKKKCFKFIYFECKEIVWYRWTQITFRRTWQFCCAWQQNGFSTIKSMSTIGLPKIGYPLRLFFAAVA